MAIRTTVMQRPEVQETSYLRAALKGMSITLRHMFRPKKITQQYPEVETRLHPRWRGTHRMEVHSDGRPKCVACGLCPTVCPANCIRLIGGEDDQGNRYPVVYEIDEFRCIFCGMCQEVCPVGRSERMADGTDDPAADVEAAWVLQAKDDEIMDRFGRKFASVPSFVIQSAAMACIPLTSGFGELMAAEVYGRYMLGVATDHTLELDQLGRERVFNLGYYTWVEQQGISLEEFDARRDQRFWKDLTKLLPVWDQMIEEFNLRTGVGRAA